MLKRAVLPLLLPALALLAACGKSEEPQAAAPPPETGVFISSGDCADSGKLTLDACAEAIDGAVAAHEVQAPTFKTVNQCAGTVGPDRCDKGVDGLNRARIQAFYVVMSTPPSAVPLAGVEARSSRVSALYFDTPTRETTTGDLVQLLFAQLAFGLIRALLQIVARKGEAFLGGKGRQGRQVWTNLLDFFLQFRAGLNGLGEAFDLVTTHVCLRTM